MDLRIVSEPHRGAGYREQLALARAAEDCGFSAFFRSDHYLTMDLTHPAAGLTDAWVTLAGLARETSRIRLGTLISPATFRPAGALAVQVAQIDDMSGGRVELGLGAGWYEAEHLAYGIPFPGVRDRFELLEEQLAAITGLWSTPAGETFSFTGRQVRFVDCPALPKPVQARLPLIIGGPGRRRTPRLAARYATEFNVGWVPPEQVAAQFARVRAACAELGRDPGELAWSTALVTVVGRDDAEVRRRAAAVGRDAPEPRATDLAGTPAEVVDKLARYAEAGVQRTYLQILDPADLDQLELIAATVAPQLDHGAPGPTS